MSSDPFTFPSVFIKKRREQHMAVLPLKSVAFSGWLRAQPKADKAQIRQQGFAALPGQTCLLTTGDAPGPLLVGVRDPVGIYDLAAAVKTLQNFPESELLNSYSYGIETQSFSKDEATRCYNGWIFGCYSFDFYKAKKPMPLLVFGKEKFSVADLRAAWEGVYLARNLINMPANRLGPAELEEAASILARRHKAKLTVITGAELLEQNFPLIHTVGMASDRAPRLLDLRWGKKSHPKVTLIGKGVCFDTGGLNLKPGEHMALMKKDMGGAAHVLGLAHAIMLKELPLRLRVLIPAVDNAVAGNAFRPGDILDSRKGLTVENTNTDAEGRLVLADALTYACEEDPDLLIDFATLTGSARAALGPDIPPYFTPGDKIAERLDKAAQRTGDPVWRMPLWGAYKKLIESSNGDLVNSAKLPGDLIYSALFLQQFLDRPDRDWIHLDIYAWEATGKPGRPAGGAETGLRAVMEFIEDFASAG